MLRVPVYILAGGKSSRFGSDKARAIIGEQTMLAHVRQMVQGHASSVTAVAQQTDQYADLGLRTIADLTPGLGPVGGVVTALADMKHEGWLLVCTCDALIIKPDWLTTLLNAAAELETQAVATTCGAVAFRGEYWQPMPGMYHTRCGEAASELAAGERRSMQRLLAMVDAIPLSMPEDWPQKWQANRPGELDEFMQS